MNKEGTKSNMSMGWNVTPSRMAGLPIVAAAISIAMIVASEFAYEAVLFVEFQSLQIIYALILALMWVAAVLRATILSLSALGITILIYCLAAYGTLESSLFISDIPASVLREEQRKYETGDTLFFVGTLFSVAGYAALIWLYRRRTRAKSL